MKGATVLFNSLAGTVQSRNCGAIPLYPYVQIRCIHFRPRGDPSGHLYLEKISPAHSCGRERASLTVTNHIALSDKSYLCWPTFMSGSARKDFRCINSMFLITGDSSGLYMKLTKRKREELRMKFGGGCAYCGEKLPTSGWQINYVDPLQSHSVQTDTDCLMSENIVAACRECSQLKGTNSLEAFRIQIMKQTERAHRNSVNFRNAIRFGLISKNHSPVIFWFEKYATQRSCVESPVVKSSSGFEPVALRN